MHVRLARATLDLRFFLLIHLAGLFVVSNSSVVSQFLFYVFGSLNS